jgi:hypothetical protein
VGKTVSASLQEFWTVLPDQTRQKVLKTLTRMVAKQMEGLGDRQEVSYEPD